MDTLVLILYAMLLVFIFLFSMTQLNLAIGYVRWKNRKENKHQNAGLSEFPFVTVQLPVYNELYVVERLIRATCELEYPRNKLEIQVLDDSDDESFELAAKLIRQMQLEGLDIQHIHRPDRTGFKAGALQFGLLRSRGEFIAIFDADFIPQKDFLANTIPHLLADAQLGVVQTRWLHLNADYSLLTRVQAFGLDAHFSVEQVARNAAHHFINFNGTAGVWRKDTIIDAGGWQSDTLTEDLDLSYRAQLKGWNFKYLEDVGSPSELPIDMNALKNQQFRWTKGAAECAVKNLPGVLRDKKLLPSHKVHAVFHLMNSFVFVCILGTAVLSIPLMFVKQRQPGLSGLFHIASFFLLSFLVLALFYWVSRPAGSLGSRLKKFSVEFPLFLSLSMGLSLHNSIAVIEGYLGFKTPFIRTPKFALLPAEGNWSNRKYRPVKMSLLTIAEFFLACYFAFGLMMAFVLHDFGLFPFHLMLTFGFAAVVWYSFKHTRGN